MTDWVTKSKIVACLLSRLMLETASQAAAVTSLIGIARRVEQLGGVSDEILADMIAVAGGHGIGQVEVHGVRRRVVGRPLDPDDRVVVNAGPGAKEPAAVHVSGCLARKRHSGSAPMPGPWAG